MAMDKLEGDAFAAMMALTAEECLALALVRDKLYVAESLDKLSEQFKELAAAMVRSEADDQGKTPEDICPCAECVSARNAKNN